MITLVRQDNEEYHIKTGVAALTDVALAEKLVPCALRGDNDATPQFLEYVRPLAGPLRHHQQLESIVVPPRSISTPELTK